MEEFKEFRGKSLDEAIQGACVYYDALREKLEIEIVQDAKSGIFGLVGARKAIIRARRATVRPRVGNLLGRSAPASTVKLDLEGAAPRAHAEGNSPDVSGKDLKADERQSRATGPKNGGKIEARSERRTSPPFRQAAAPHKADTQQKTEKPATTADALNERPMGNRTEFAGNGTPYAPSRRPRVPANEARPSLTPAAARFHDADSCEDGDDAAWAAWDDLARERTSFSPGQALSTLDQEALRAAALEAAEKMVTAILGETPITVSILEHRVDVRVDCGVNSGLLIGREGQTLSALQYLASRMVSRKMDAPVRVQFDVGDYRERQDERLRDLALSLAERVRQTGRPCSTRPMSSYHRRLVHMALQDAPDVQTRSSGEGPLKRIIIQRRRQERTENGTRPDQAKRSGQTDL